MATITTVERIFRTQVFAADLAPYIDYNKVAVAAREVGGHFRVENRRDGSAVVVTYWLDDEA